MSEKIKFPIPYFHKKPGIFQPLEDMLKNYPNLVKTHYPTLFKQDIHLAELFRQKSILQPGPGILLKKPNPFQARIDRQGRMWIEVLVERKKGVKLSELRKHMKVQGKPGRGKFISGKVKTEELEWLIANTTRVQTARSVQPTLYRSVHSMNASKPDLSQLEKLPKAADGHEFVPDGQGVIIGIVDIEGCDFKHPNFLRASDTNPGTNETRLLYLWDQNGKNGEGRQKPAKYSYGVEYEANRINLALAKGEGAYDDLKYTPADSAHGTHVMDIAAGNSPYPGVAPQADLIFVHVGRPAKPRKDELGNLGSSTCLVDAVQYIFEKAEALGKPAVVNLSLAANGGAHDGTSLVESKFDELLAKPGRAIVIAAGNSYQDRIHTVGTVKDAEMTDISWFIEDRTQSHWDFRQEVEIWYAKNARLVVEVLDPEGESYVKCQLNQFQSFMGTNSPTPFLLVRHQPPEPTQGEIWNKINIFLDNTDADVALGPWKLRLSLDDSVAGNNTSVDFHAWIESNEVCHSHFSDEIDQPGFTLNTIANGTLPLVVGSYDPRPQVLPTSDLSSNFSSAGPTLNPNNKEKPDLCAPGEYILAARARHSGGTLMDGTSMAAPHVTGLIALMFQISKELTMQEIREILTTSVDPEPPPGMAKNPHNPQSGFGRVNAVKALSKIV